MNTAPPPLVGTPLHELDTPALLLDKRAMENNLRRMADFFHHRRAKLRPHFKNHKCIELARRQLAAGGAVGLCCAKLSEAEVLAEAGFDNILIANQVVGLPKMERLAQLARRVRLQVAVDHVAQIEAISEAASRAGSIVGVLVEVDIGMGRCGVPPGPPALELAREIRRRPGVRFDGLQAYEGHLVSLPDREERRRRVMDAVQPALDTRRLIEQAGIPVGVISGGSTANYAILAAVEGMDEIQAGTYVTMDCTYQRISPEFENALTILARVISRPRPRVAVFDVGMKGISPEFGSPQIKGHPEIQIPSFRSEEHTVAHNTPDWPVGQVVELIPSHACTTCNLHRQFCVHEKGRVVDLWPIEAAGKLT